MVSRLKEMRLEGLFGLYTHNIRLNIDQRITAIIGPNGRGKTVCLKFIEALFRKNYGYFLNVPFSSVRFYFTEGESVLVICEQGGTQESPSDGTRLQFLLEIPGRDVIQWHPAQLNPQNRLVRELSRYLPYVHRIATDEWIDQRQNEILSLSEVMNRYSDVLPDKIVTAIRAGEPKEFSDLISQIDCHLIETQRLLVLSTITEVEEDEDGPPYGYRRHRPDESRLAIRQKAQKLRSILGAKLAEYATLSQSLDRSFPRRVLEAQGGAVLTQPELRTELETLDQRRKALMSAGILKTEFEPVSISGAGIDPGVAKVLEIYAQDTAKKLDVFEQLLLRLDLFKELLQSRFTDKIVQIDRETGFSVNSKVGHEIPLEKLSSGEQHQLILFFDLLFEVKENSLILIDEPELSLHVTWQKSFLDSLRKMIALNRFDVIVATHSPPLVARHFDLTVELGPVDD